MSLKDPIQHVYDRIQEDMYNEVRQYKRPLEHFRASEAGDCWRAVYYRLAGYRPAPKSPKSFLYGTGGDVDHNLIRQMLSHYGIELRGITFEADGSVKEHIHYKQTLPTKHGEITVSFRSDGEIHTPHGWTHLEIKGKGKNAVYWMNQAYQQGGHDAAVARLLDKYRGDYWQCQIGMKLTGHKHAYLLWKDRDSENLGLHRDNDMMQDIEVTGIYLDFDEEAWQQIVDRFTYIKGCLEKREPPSTEYPAGSDACKKWCRYWYLCHGADQRKRKGMEPSILYPGPQIDIHADQGDDSDD